jgi:hypothetical protein
MRWKGTGEKLTQEGHMLYFSRNDRLKEGVGFIVHKNTTNTVMFNLEKLKDTNIAKNL